MLSCRYGKPFQGLELIAATIAVFPSGDSSPQFQTAAYHAPFSAMSLTCFIKPPCSSSSYGLIRTGFVSASSSSASRRGRRLSQRRTSVYVSVQPRFQVLHLCSLTPITATAPPPRFSIFANLRRGSCISVTAPPSPPSWDHQTKLSRRVLHLRIQASVTTYRS